MNLFFKKANKEGSEKIDLEAFIEKFRGTNVLTPEINDKITNCILQGEKYISLPVEQLKILEKELSVFKEKESKLYTTASLNNNGIAQEKEGNIDLAIQAYEENIKLNYPATHSYERLMVLYRKSNELENEIRVIEKAIEIFTEENEKRLKRALSEVKSYEEKEKIKKGHLDCENVRGSDGWVIYSPYPVKKYKDRLLKVLSLKEKQKK